MQTRKYNLNKRNISGKDMIDAVVAHSRVDFAEAKMLTELKDRILLVRLCICVLVRSWVSLIICTWVILTLVYPLFLISSRLTVSSLVS